ncbi:MarR family transcriptional regulator [Marinitoga arctica]
MNKAFEIIILFKEIRESFKKSMTTFFDTKDITSSQWIILGELLKNGKMTMSELSKKVGLSNSTVSGIVDRLEKHEYVKRIRDKKDRRKIYVEITDKFNDIIKRKHQLIEKKIEEKLNTVSEKELESVLNGLKILKKIFEEE